MTNTNQLELGLSTAHRVVNSLNHRQRRINRATWWFTQMRRTVDTAFVWQPATPPARPEQAWFNEGRMTGRIELDQTAQLQVCE